MALPIPPVPQSSPTEPTALADTVATTSFITATNYPLLGNSAAPLFPQQEQRPNAFSHVHVSDSTMLAISFSFVPLFPFFKKRLVTHLSNHDKPSFSG